MLIGTNIHITSNQTNLSRTIKGRTLRKGIVTGFQKVCLYSRVNNQLLATTESDVSGHYEFSLDGSSRVYIVALDSQSQHNAVIQDNVVPK